MWDISTIIASHLSSSDLQTMRLLEEAKIAIQESRYSDAKKLILEAGNSIKNYKTKRR